MGKDERFGLVLTQDEKLAIAQLAEKEGGLSQAAILRRLIRNAARSAGLWPPMPPAANPTEEAANARQAA